MGCLYSFFLLPVILLFVVISLFLGLFRGRRQTPYTHRRTNTNDNRRQNSSSTTDNGRTPPDININPTINENNVEYIDFEEIKDDNLK